MGEASSVIAMRPYLPAKNFATSKRFYAGLGFSVSSLGEDLAEVAYQSHAFLLQNFYDEKYASYYMMQLLVADLEDWWVKVRSLKLGDNYGLKDPAPPIEEPSGLTVLYVLDPSGVIWQIAQRIP